MMAIGVTTPVLLATIAVLTFAGLEISGRTPSAIGPPRNIAEAAAMSAASEALRLFEAGEDPNRVWPVRPEIISSTITQVTGLEAAIWSHHWEMVDMFDRRGAIRDAQTRQHLICLASDVRDPDVLNYLSPGRAPECVQGAALERVRARSIQER
jgi:hypothetical protein